MSQLTTTAVRRMPSPLRKDAGMTLVEIMMALTVLTVVMVMLFGAFLSSHMLSRVNKDKHRALMDTTALMEQMAMVPIGNLGTTFPNATNIPEFNNLHIPNQRVQVVYDNGNPNARPLGYQVVSTWTTAGRLPARLTVRGVRAR
jgi:prepilin-type N-terminal cleavage/methylation domain-containing protein